MTADAPSHAAADARTAWTIGGGLLILSGVCAAIDQLAPSGPAALGAAVLWAAALIIFAIGIRGSGSVTGRPAGTIVFFVFAAWSIVEAIQFVFFPFGRGLAVPTVIMVSYGLEVITLVLAALAGAVVAASGAVAPRWNWAPLWVLIVLVVFQIAQIALVTVVHSSAILTVITPIDAIVKFAALAFLGGAAIVLSTRGSLTAPAVPARTA